MALILPEIKHEYLFHLDTEETKNSVFDLCRIDGKEAAYSTFGTAQNDSEYLPAPTVNPDYYMAYCSSDGYDYLKDYRLVWGYSIGIIELDVICSLTTGEHLAEGKEACDAYETENTDGKDVDWKRGIWLKFSGNRNVSPARIGEVVLPDYIISLKDLCKLLQIRGGCTVEQFNTDNILNIDKAFSSPQIYIGKNVEFNFKNILTALYTFAQTKRTYNLSFSEINDINYNNTFVQADLTKIPNGFVNVGGTRCFAESSISDISNSNIKLYTQQFRNCTNITNINNTINLIATDDISQCFASCSINNFNPNIDWSECKTANNMLYGGNSVLNNVELDFTTATKDIAFEKFNNGNSTIINLNIIANSNIKLIGNLFYISSNNPEINVINTLCNRNGFVFSLSEASKTKIIGNFNTHYFIYCNNGLSDNYTILTDDSKVNLYNDDDVNFTNSYGLINYYFSGMNRTINKININFDNCSIIGFYKRDNVYYKDYYINKIIINSIKDKVKIYNHLIADIDLNVNNNTVIELYGNGKYYSDSYYSYLPNVYHKLNIIKEDSEIGEIKAVYPTFIINAEKYNINIIDNLNDIKLNYKFLYVDKCNNITINNYYDVDDYRNAISNTNIIIENKCNKISFEHSDIAFECIYISSFIENINLILDDYRIKDGYKINLFTYKRDYSNINNDFNEKISDFINFPTLTTNNEESDYLFIVNNWCKNLDNDYIYKNINIDGNAFDITRYSITNYICNGTTINDTPIKTINLTEEKYIISDITLFKVSEGYTKSISLYDTQNNTFDIDIAFGILLNGWILDFNNSTSNNNFIIRTGTQISNYINNDITLNIEKLDPGINDYNGNTKYLYINSSCINLNTIIINFNTGILYININTDILPNITTLMFNVNNDNKYSIDLDLKEGNKLSQESINSIVTPTNFASGITLTINTIPFQYITDEQKQALVNAGVTLVEYIPQIE